MHAEIMGVNRVILSISTSSELGWNDTKEEKKGPAKQGCSTQAYQLLTQPFWKITHDSGIIRI